MTAPVDDRDPSDRNPSDRNPSDRHPNGKSSTDRGAEPARDSRDSQERLRAPRPLIRGAQPGRRGTGKFSALVLGLWIGASVAILGVVGYSFPGITRGIEANPALATRVGFAPDDELKKKSSVPWVVVGELNRAYFLGWNRAQLVLGALALGAAAFDRRRSVAILVGLATIVVCALTFHFGPEITASGRALDFVPRDPPPPALADFDATHRLYTRLEVIKVAFLLVAATLAFRRPRAEA